MKLLLVCALAALAAAAVIDQPSWTRFVHASEDDFAVDFALEGDTKATNVPYRNITQYYNTNNCPSRDVRVSLNGSPFSGVQYDSPYIETVALLPNRETVVTHQSAFCKPPAGNFALSFLHLSPYDDFRVVRVSFENGPVLFPSVVYKSQTSQIEGPAGIYTLIVEGDTASMRMNVHLDSQMSYTMLLTGEAVVSLKRETDMV